MKNRKLSIRISDADWQQFHDKAEQADMTLTEYVTACCLGKRIVVIDIGEGPVLLINPEVLETSGEQTGDEGCLSVQGKAGQVTRPDYVKVKAQDINMEEIIVEGEELMARALMHEIDHLDGKLYVDIVEGDLHDVTYEEEEEE